MLTPPGDLTTTRARPPIPEPPVSDKALARYLVDTERKMDLDDADKEALREWATRVNEKTGG